MPDTPDYNKYLPNSNRFSLQDLGELAARLGSPVIADRRGEVIFMDKFDYGLSGWSSSVVGAGSAAIITTGYTLHSPFSLGLKSGAVTPNSVLVSRSIPAIDTSKVGFETSFILSLNVVSVVLSFRFFEGSDGFEVNVKFDRTTNKLYIQHSDFVYHEITGLPTGSIAAASLINIKIVADIETGKYIRLIFNATEIDISAYELAATGSSVAGTFNISITSVGGQFFVGTLMITHIIVTANEP